MASYIVHRQLLFRAAVTPDTWAVSQVRGAECVVMAGDPKQLPPTLMSDGALDARMDRTLFDRLQDCGEHS